MKRTSPKAERAVQFLPVLQLKPNPWNRTRFDPAALKELARSIRAEGIREPLIVRLVNGGRPELRSTRTAVDQKGSERKLMREPLAAAMFDRPSGPPPLSSTATPLYQIASGNRRWLAAQQAHLKTVPCLIESLSDEQVAEDNITMNIQREDIPPLELARMVQDYLTRFDKSQADVARAFGKSRAWVSQLIRFQKLPSQALKVFTAVNTGWENLRLISSLPQDLSIKLAQETEEQKLSPKGIARRCRQLLFGSRSTGRYGAGPREPDPFQKDWERVNQAMLKSSNVWWEVRYTRRAIAGGKPELGWDFFVKPPFDVSRETLAEWFAQMANALRGSSRGVGGYGSNIDPLAPLPPYSLTPLLGKVRLPKTPAEEKELRALAKRGPRFVYAWIYGKDSAMTQTVPIDRWEDAGLTPEEGLTNILDGLRGPSGPEKRKP